MKQNTRIEKLMHSKRMKKVVNVATVIMLVCPLVIGAVNALANTDASESEITETAPTEETTTSEIQSTVESTNLPVEPTEPLPSVPEATSSTESTGDTSTNIFTGTADEVGLDTTGIRSAMASVEEARMYEKRYTIESFAEFSSTVEQYYSNGQTIITATDWTNAMLEQDQFWIDSNTNNMTDCLSKLVYDSEEAVVERHRLELAQLIQEHNARVASDYTPESWKAYSDYLNSADPNHQGTILEATQKIVSKEWNPMYAGVSGGYVYNLWPHALSLLVDSDENTSEIVGYTFSADKTTVEHGELVSFTLVAHHEDGTDSPIKIGTDGKAILSVGGFTTDSSSIQMNIEPGVYEAKAFSYGGTNNGMQLGETILITVVSESNKPDITKLKELYDKYKSLDEDDYHPTNWKVFKQRIVNDTDLVSLTESILANPNQGATEEVVSDLVNRWESHLSWLSPDLKLLQAKYDRYLSLFELDYTPKSWQAFQSYLAENPSIVSYTEIALDEESIANGLTIEPVEFTIGRWNDAFALLVFNDYEPEEWMKSYYEELKEILVKYNKLNEADYTADSFKAMREYFKIGKFGDYIEHIKYLIDSGKTPDIPELDKWFERTIATGWAGLDLLIKVPNDNKEVDLSKLQAVYDSIGKQEQYTAESWAKFQKDADYWLTEAKRILDGRSIRRSTLNQAYVDEITEGLQKAIDTILVKKDNNGGNGNNSGNDNNQGNVNNGNTNVNNQNNNSSGSSQSGGKTNASKPNSGKKLPETGEKETFVMFLTGIVALGLTMFSFMRKREESL